VVVRRVSPGGFLGHWSYFNTGEAQFLSILGSTSEVLILNQSRDAGNRGASFSVVADDEGTVVFEFSRHLMDKCVIFSYYSISKNLIAILEQLSRVLPATIILIFEATCRIRAKWPQINARFNRIQATEICKRYVHTETNLSR
jgi:hypothetical protein